MPQRTAAIDSLPEAFGMVKAMRADGPDWGTDCRQAVRRAPAGIIQGGMADDVDRRPGSPESRGGDDRRNGTYQRPALRTRQHRTGVPRTRRYRPYRHAGELCVPRARSTGSSLPASCPARPPAGSARSFRPCPAPGPARDRQPRGRDLGRRHRRLTDRCKALPGWAWKVAMTGVPDRARCACRPHHRERTRHGTRCRRPTPRVAPRSRAERHREPGRDPKRHCPYGGSPTIRTHPKTPPNVRSANPTGNVPTKMCVTTRASPPRLRHRQSGRSSGRRVGS